MSIDRDDTDKGIRADAGSLRTGAAAAEMRARDELDWAVQDLAIPETARIDERTRASAHWTLSSTLAAIETAMRKHAGRLLVARGEPEAALAMVEPKQSVIERLWQSPILRDPGLTRELLARARQDLVAEALPTRAPASSEAPSLLSELTAHDDAVIAAGAMQLLSAESRRRAERQLPATRSDLPAELHHRLVWVVAAAIRAQHGESAPAADNALVEAAQRSLAAHDEGDRLEGAAVRLASAIDAHPGELPDLLIGAIEDRRLALFIALLAHACAISYAQAQQLVLDRDPAQLAVALKALDVPRAAIAKIGHVLCEADPRRDLDALADVVDSVDHVAPADAQAALAELRLPQDYRDARLALGEKAR
jgi:hypothetical protein